MKLFKTLIIVSLIFTCISQLDAAIAEDWRIVQKGGQLNGIWPFRWVGFDRVDSDPVIKTLSCHGAGYSECEISGSSLGGSLEAHSNTMVEYAEDQIYNHNVLSGSYNNNLLNPDDNKLYYCTVVWQSSQSYEVNMDVLITEAPEPLN